jgi:hypothetical protein
MVGILPSTKLIKEAQAVIAFAIYESIHRYTGTKKKKDIALEMGKRFHGDPDNTDSIGELQKFLKAEGVLSGILTEDEQVSATGTGDREWMVHPFLTRCPGSVVVGSSLPQERLERATNTSRALISGRALKEKAEKVAENCRKAIVFAEEYLKKGNGNLHTGHTIEDYLHFVLIRMKEELKKPKKVAHGKGSTKEARATSVEEKADGSDNDERVEEEEEDRNNKDDDNNPSDNNNNNSSDGKEKCLASNQSAWFFDGFWAFYLFGPYPNPDSSVVLSTGQVTGPKGTLGRAFAKDVAQNGDGSSTKKATSPAKEAVRAQVMVSKAAYAAQMSVERGRDSDRDIAYLTSQIELVKLQMKISIEMKDLEEMKELKEKIKSLVNEIEEKRSELAKRRVAEFAEATGHKTMPKEVGQVTSLVESPMYSTQPKSKKAKTAKSRDDANLSPVRLALRISPRRKSPHVTRTEVV